MNELTHQEAQKRMQAACDGLLTAAEQASFEAHLQTCPTCRAAWTQLQAREKRLGRVLRAGFASIPEPSATTLGKIQVQNRRNQFMTRTQTIFATLAVTAALALAIFLFSSLIPEIKKSPAIAVSPQPSPTASPTVAPTVEKTSTLPPEPPKSFSPLVIGQVLVNPGPLIEFSPNVLRSKTIRGQWIAFQACNANCNSETDRTFDLFVAHPDGSGLRAISDQGHPFISVDIMAWSPNGRYLAFWDVLSEKNLGIFDSETGQVVYAGFTDERFISKTQKPMPFAWAPDSSKIAFMSQVESSSNIHLADPQTGKIRQFTNLPGLEYGMVWSPDSSQIAYFNTSRLNIYYDDVEVGDIAVYVQPVDGKTPKKLADGVSSNAHMIWPDPEHIYINDKYLNCANCFTGREGVYELRPSQSVEPLRQLYWVDDSLPGPHLLVDHMYKGEDSLVFAVRENGNLQDPQAAWAWLKSNGNIAGAIAPSTLCESETFKHSGEVFSSRPEYALLGVECAGQLRLYLIRHEPVVTSDLISLIRVLDGDFTLNAWSPDGDRVLLTRPQADGGVAFYELSLAELFSEQPSISPRLVFDLPGWHSSVIWQP